MKKIKYWCDKCKKEILEGGECRVYFYNPNNMKHFCFKCYLDILRFVDGKYNMNAQPQNPTGAEKDENTK